MSEGGLHILWTSGDKLTANNMVLMYATNSMLKGWHESVTVIIWGASAALAANDADVREKIKAAQHAGVQFCACKACAVNLGVRPELEEIGVDVKYFGEPLTELIKNERHLITI